MTKTLIKPSLEEFYSLADKFKEKIIYLLKKEFPDSRIIEKDEENGILSPLIQINISQREGALISIVPYKWGYKEEEKS